MSIQKAEYFIANLDQIQTCFVDKIVSPFVLKERIDAIWGQFFSNNIFLLSLQDYSTISYRITVLRGEINKEVNKLMQEWQKVRG